MPDSYIPGRRRTVISLHISQPERLVLALYPEIPSDRPPSNWLGENTDRIWKAIDDLEGVSREEFAGLDKLIFPRLTTYVVAHLKFSGQNPRQLGSLRATLLEWAASGTERQLVSYPVIQSTLWKYLAYCKHPLTSPDKFDVGVIVERDVTCIAAYVLTILSDHQRKKSFLEQDSQAILNLLQALVDYLYLDANWRSEIVRASISLSESSGHYPTSFMLQVKNQGEGPVSSGTFRDVWKGDVGLEKAVAIKVLRNSHFPSTDMALKAFTHKAFQWRQLRHPNVLPFYGISFGPQDPRLLCLIFPWMENGNIIDYLKKTRDVNRRYLLINIIYGLQYLHTSDPIVIHGNLKGTNVLITPALRACLADFGLSTFTHDAADTQDTIENALSGDIYSFGVLCYEVLTGHTPGPDTLIGNFTPLPFSRKFYLSETRSADDILQDLIKECCQENPQLRPTIRTIVKSLPDLLFGEDYFGMEPPWGDRLEPAIYVPSPLLEFPTALEMTDQPTVPTVPSRHLQPESVDADEQLFKVAGGLPTRKKKVTALLAGGADTSLSINEPPIDPPESSLKGLEHSRREPATRFASGAEPSTDLLRNESTHSLSEYPSHVPNENLDAYPARAEESHNYTNRDVRRMRRGRWRFCNPLRWCKG